MNNSGNGTSHELEGEPLACPISPWHRPGECRVIESRILGVEGQVKRLCGEVKATHTLLGFVIDELKVIGSYVGRKPKDPRKKGR